MEKKEVRNYFNAHAADWLRGGYESPGHTYPTAFHRARLVARLLNDDGRSYQILDLGCGGGDIAFLLAEQGHTVIGVDQSEKMLAIAEERRSRLTPEVSGRVRFIRGDVESPPISVASVDAVVCMGVIGYLRNDAALFSSAFNLLRPGGRFFVSCRNRLFNMASLGWRTHREIKDGSAKDLIDELSSYYQAISRKDCHTWLTALRNAVDAAIANLSNTNLEIDRAKTEVIIESSFEARQHTPNEIVESASASGFRLSSIHGVHPHILDPNANTLLPPGIFNQLSSSLETLDHLPTSIVWSSVFIAVLNKEARP